MAKFYHTCQHCGSNLDPGESCDCQEIEQAAREKLDRINEREGVAHGEDYFRILCNEIRAQWSFSDLTIANYRARQQHRMVC